MSDQSRWEVWKENYDDLWPSSLLFTARVKNSHTEGNSNGSIPIRAEEITDSWNAIIWERERKMGGKGRVLKFCPYVNIRVSTANLRGWTYTVPGCENTVKDKHISKKNPFCPFWQLDINSKGTIMGMTQIVFFHLLEKEENRKHTVQGSVQ